MRKIVMRPLKEQREVERKEEVVVMKRERRSKPVTNTHRRS